MAMKLNLDESVNYHYGEFPPQELEYNTLVQGLIEATDAVARYDQMLKGMHNSEILLAPMRKQEAVISSRMEGTISTIDEILKYEADQAEGEELNPNVRSEVVETFLYQVTLRGAQEAMESGRPLSQSLIKALHQSLLSVGRGASKSPGEFKREQNYLGTRNKTAIRFVPISPEKLQEGLDDLFRFVEDESRPVLVRTALAHIEFEALHPFEDGNGRIGRMLITLMMWKAGVISAPHFYISSYFEEHKDQYIELMRDVSRNGAWENWCNFFLAAVREQAIRNLEVAENIQALYEQMKVRFSELLSSKWSVNALDFVFTNPVFRNNRFTNASGISAPTAARFTRVLLENDLIVCLEESAGRRPALYSFEPLLRLVRV